MIYFTGDIHGDPYKIERFVDLYELTSKDVIVILGDVGANYYGSKKDDRMKSRLNSVGPTIFCIHGNHEMRPTSVKGYKLEDYCGGKVWVQDKYPNLLFAKDGEIFSLGEYKYLVIGGAYSVDKYYRLKNKFKWFKDEQPSQEIKDFVEEQIKNNKVDVILSHTCPYKYEPREMFLAQIDQSTVDSSTEEWLDKIEESVNYKRWLCGHWHTDKVVDKMRFLYNDLITADSINGGWYM